MNTQFPTNFRGMQRDRLAVPENSALLHLIHAGQQLDEGRFSRTVLAYQTVNLARFQRKVNVPQGIDAVEGFADMFGLQQHSRSPFRNVLQ